MDITTTRAHLAHQRATAVMSKSFTEASMELMVMVVSALFIGSVVVIFAYPGVTGFIFSGILLALGALSVPNLQTTILENRVNKTEVKRIDALIDAL